VVPRARVCIDVWTNAEQSRCRRRVVCPRQPYRSYMYVHAPTMRVPSLRGWLAGVVAGRRWPSTTATATATATAMKMDNKDGWRWRWRRHFFCRRSVVTANPGIVNREVVSRQSSIVGSRRRSVAGLSSSDQNSRDGGGAGSLMVSFSQGSRIARVAGTPDLAGCQRVVVLLLMLMLMLILGSCGGCYRCCITGWLLYLIQR
jgi:hypothetical protein